MGVEPTPSVWKTEVLPLYDARKTLTQSTNERLPSRWSWVSVERAVTPLFHSHPTASNWSRQGAVTCREVSHFRDKLATRLNEHPRRLPTSEDCDAPSYAFQREGTSNVLAFSPAINLVPRGRIELPASPCHSDALPLSEQGMVPGEGFEPSLLANRASTLPLRYPGTNLVVVYDFSGSCSPWAAASIMTTINWSDRAESNRHPDIGNVTFYH